MARANDQVAAVLQEYADLLAITGGAAFKVRAYEKAARAVGGHHADVSGLDAEGLRDIPGVGASIAEKIAEYLATGRIPSVEEARRRIPAGVRELTAIPTLGPKKALTLYEDLRISSVDELADAIHAERLRGVKGFGPRTEENLLHGIGLLHAAGRRIPLDAATAVAEEIADALAKVPGCADCAYAGSLRRMRETVGDIDILVAAEDSGPFMAAFRALPLAAEVIAHGAKKTSVRTPDGLQVDLRVLPPRAWGAGLIYFTGSKAHNIRIREIAVRRGLKLSEYGLFDVASGELLASREEADVYRRLGLPWIPPVLREDRGEIAAAAAGELPDLVTVADLHGDLHTHTDLTDGVAPLAEMVRAAREHGYEYYAVTDHAPGLAMQRMTAARMLAQRERVRQLDGRAGGPRLLHGTELNIAPDGSVDWPDDFLAGFDLCVASVHSHFGLDRAAQTRRLVRACENRYVRVLGHPTARRLGRRPEIDADWDAVFAACARTGTVLEINGQPERIDLGDEDILRAKRHGVRFAVDSDAHSVPHLGYTRYGAGTARRGWLTAEDVVNTWPLERLRALLAA